MLLTWRYLDTFGVPTPSGAEIALEKAEHGVVRVPRGDDGRPDYRALKVGQRAWVTIDHPDSPLRGRVVLVERTSSGFAVVDDPYGTPGQRLGDDARGRYAHALRAAQEEKRREEEEAAEKRQQADGLFDQYLPPEGAPPLAVGAFPEHDIPMHHKPE